MSIELEKMKKEELIDMIQKLKNELEEDKAYMCKMFQVENYSEVLIQLATIQLGGHTVQSLIDENDKLKDVVVENEKLKKDIQKLKNERIQIINEYKERNGIQKIKNERRAGRKQKLTDKQIQDILMHRSHGTSMKRIAQYVGCSVGLVHKTINEHTKKEDSPNTGDKNNNIKKNGEM